MNSRRIISLMIIIILSFTCLSGCKNSTSQESISNQAILFDTIIQITLYDTQNQKILDHCFSMCEDFEQELSRTIDTSEVSKINQAHGQPTEVSDNTIQLLKKGIEYAKLSGGSFDITIAPLSTLWDFKNNTGTIPNQAAIDNAKSHVNYESICIEGNTVTLTDPEAAIDLGGIAKGFIADKLKEYLVSKNIQHAIINLGGNVLTIGNKPDGSDFNVGLQKPFDKQNAAITSVKVNNQSVVSSGVYERYFKLGDKIYHHILNPATGYPYENNLLGVSIISQYSVDGDGLSTTCFALGLEKGMELIDSLDNTEAIFITDDYQLHYSSGLKK